MKKSIILALTMLCLPVCHSHAQSWWNNYWKQYLSYFTTQSSSVAVDEQTFPDANLRSYISTNCDTDGDGELSESEIKNVTKLYLQQKGISDLTGLENFTSLKTLYIWGNNITTLEPLRPIASNLEFIEAGGNDFTNEGVAVVSKMTALRHLTLGSELITSLDVSNAPNLTELSCTSCSLTQLDLSNNTKLTRLSCGVNQTLQSLDLSNNPLLKELNFGSSALNFDKITLPANCKIQKLNCSYCNLNYIPTAKMPNIYYLDCKYSNNVGSIDLSVLPNLQYFYAHKNNISSFDFTNNPKLRTVMISYNPVTSLVFGASTYTQLTYLEMARCGIDNDLLPDLALFPNLHQLYCSGNKISAINLKPLTNLTDFLIFENQLPSLDVSANTKLETLKCQNNAISTLDLSNNQELEDIDCSNNGLYSLTLPAVAENSENNTLEKLICSKNHLAALNLSAYKKLVKGRYWPQSDISGQTLDFSMVANNGGQIYIDVPTNVENGKVTSLKADSYLSNDNPSVVSGDENNQLVLASNPSSNLQLFYYDAETDSVAPISLTYYYNTEASDEKLASMDVTVPVEAYVHRFNRESTMYLPFAYTLPDNVTPYIVTAVYDTITNCITEVELGENRVINAYQPMVLASDDTYAVYNVSDKEGYTASADNLLKGVLETTEVEPYTVYTLTLDEVNNKGYGVWYYSGTSLPPFKCYVPVESQAKAKRFIDTEDNSITGISHVNTEETSEGKWYTINGTELSGKPTTRGIYIHNGKKIIVK
ncbi:MAG: leucine-rich repeat domain-containing protein [Prevotella sp.]